MDDGTAITVYYDNIVILSRTPEQQKVVVRRIQDNMKELNAELKLTKRKEAGLPAPQTPKEHQAAEKLEWRYTDVRKEEVQILGMVVRFYPETDTFVAFPRKRESWISMSVPDTMSCRDAAEFFGRLVFAAQLRHTCLYATGCRVVKLATSIGVRAHACGWEGTFKDAAAIHDLREVWASLEVETNAPMPRKAQAQLRHFEYVRK